MPRQVEGRARRVLQIATDTLEGAECIADALGKYEPQLERADGCWVLVIATERRAGVIPILLGALKACLDENAISMVRVTLDGRTYAMVGARRAV